MPKKPNLLYVFADQLRYFSLGYNGDTLACTPNIDALSKESLNCQNTVSGHPVCAPYRASLFTGKYTTSTGMVINEIRINPSAHVTFADVLNDGGYTPEYVGKWHMYAAELGNHFDPKNSYVPEGADRLGFNGYFAAYNFHHKYYKPEAYFHLNSPEKHFVEGYEPDVQTDMAIERMEHFKNDDRPFALFLSYGTPHDPWTKDNTKPEDYAEFENTNFPLPPNYRRFNDPRADFWARFMPFERNQLNDWKRAYYAMVKNLDYNVGRLIKYLDESGLCENTILVFTSDHGEMFGAHGRRAKNIFYEEAVRVPFLLRKKGIVNGVSTVNLNTVDIMPTLLSLMSLPIPDGVQGKDRSSELIGAPLSDPLDGSLMMCTGPTAIYGNGFEWRAYRTNQYTYAVFRRGKKEYLFDNLSDCYQLVNLAKKPEFSAIKSSLKDKMYAEMRKIGDGFEPNSYYRKHWVKDRKILPELSKRK